MNKIFVKVLAGTILASMLLTSCGAKSQEASVDPETEKMRSELEQNDYRGGVKRTMALQDVVLSTMENMKQNNETIRNDNPNSYWSQEGYQDFVVNFMNADIINDTQWFNEEETTWAESMENMRTSENSFTKKDTENEGKYTWRDGVKIRRNEKDDYSITSSETYSYDGVTYDTPYTYKILYDCDKDWCKAYAETSFTAAVPPVTVELYEYARIDNNTFAIQTDQERLVVVLNDAAPETPLDERELKEFYYSKLSSDGERTTFTPYTRRQEIGLDDVYRDENIEMNNIMETFYFINDKGDMNNIYGKNDSIFKAENISEQINGDWVFEDKSLQQAMVYKDGALVVITYNKLSESYERFIYTLDGVSDSVVNEIQNMIEIKDLVGTHKNDSTASPAPDKAAETDSSDSSEATDSEGSTDSTESNDGGIPYPPEGDTAEENETEGAGGTAFSTEPTEETVVTTTAETAAPDETAAEPAETAPAETTAVPTETAPAETTAAAE